MKKVIGYQICVSPENGHSHQVFDRFEGKFRKDGDENCVFKTEAEAEDHIEIARRAWNEFDEICVEEVSFEEDEDEDEDE